MIQNPRVMYLIKLKIHLSNLLIIKKKEVIILIMMKISQVILVKKIKNNLRCQRTLCLKRMKSRL